MSALRAQADMMLLAPAGILAQVQRACAVGQAVYPARNPANASRSALVKAGSATAITLDGDDEVAVIGHLPDPAETRKAGLWRISRSERRECTGIADGPFVVSRPVWVPRAVLLLR
jgi:hypothetical protein